MSLQHSLEALAGEGGGIVPGLVVLFALLISHALCDHPLQGEFVALRKNRHYRPDGPDAPIVWPYCLSAHALIHAGGVWLVTGRASLALAEFVLHWLIDFFKCENKFNIHIDQLLHILCKVGYVVAIASLG